VKTICKKKDDGRYARLVLAKGITIMIEMPGGNIAMN
jgi:hypothetical protein